MGSRRDPWYKTPWIVGLLYVAMIPVFAIIYTSLPPRSFYHESAKYEPATEAKRLAIETSLADKFATTLKTGAPIYDGWIIDDVRVLNFFSDENAEFDQPTFEIHLTTHREPRSVPANNQSNVIAQVTLIRQGTVNFPLGDAHPTSIAHAISVTPFIGWTFPNNVVFPNPAPQFNAAQTWLVISLDLDDQINEYENTKRGFPIPGERSRMPVRRTEDLRTVVGTRRGVRAPSDRVEAR